MCPNTRPKLRALIVAIVEGPLMVSDARETGISPIVKVIELFVHPGALGRSLKSTVSIDVSNLRPPQRHAG